MTSSLAMRMLLFISSLCRDLAIGILHLSPQTTFLLQCLLHRRLLFQLTFGDLHSDPLQAPRTHNAGRLDQATLERLQCSKSILFVKLLHPRIFMTSFICILIHSFFFSFPFVHFRKITTWRIFTRIFSNVSDKFNNSTRTSAINRPTSKFRKCQLCRWWPCLPLNWQELLTMQSSDLCWSNSLS